jgi:membrane protein
MFSPSALFTRARRLLLLALLALRSWPWFNTWQVLRQRFREDRLGMTAGSLTFTTLIALVPLLTVMLALFTAFPMFAKFQDALQQYFLQSLVPDGIAKPVLGSLTSFAKKANRLGTVGLVLLGASALSLMLTVDRALNAIWRVRRPRPIGQRVLVYWAALTLGPLIMGVSLSLTSYALSASKGLVSALPGGVSVALDALEFLLLMAATAALFHYVPNTSVRWRHAWAGAAFVALGIELAKRVLGWYISTVPSFSTIYGAFATVPIFLLWLYLVWAIVLLGAVVAAYAPSLRQHLTRWAPAPGLHFTLAVAVMAQLWAVRREGGRGLSLEQLGERLRIDPLQIEPLVDVLASQDWVARLDEASAAQGQRLVLICEPERVSAAALVEALLLKPHPATRNFCQATGLAQLTLAQLLTPAH